MLSCKRFCEVSIAEIELLERASDTLQIKTR